MTTWIRGLLAAAILAAATGVRAQSDGRVDAETGRDLAHYPPSRLFDIIHIRVALDIPTMTEARASAVETLRVRSLGTPRTRLELDAKGLDVHGVAVNGAPAEFTHVEDRLSVRLPSPAPLDGDTEVTIRYDIDYSMNNGAGLTWTPGREGARSETDRWPQIHSQGEPDYARTWFACHDFPNERMTTELLVTVGSEYQVCSNGRLVGSARAGAGRTTWHWLQDKPHASYLVLLVIGKFAIVGLDGRDAGLSRPLPIYLYAPLGSEASAQKAYARTPEMLAFFEETFGEPYPWDKYAQLLVRNFAAGGMENTSGTTMQSSSAYAPPGSQDDVIAHEACHQWTGDLVTCKSWEYAWLNEGWASMGEALWAEHDAERTGGREAGRRAYLLHISRYMFAERAMNRTAAPRSPGMASNRYEGPFDVFMRPNNIYSKGALVLHMLRMRLGDDAFFRGVRSYIRDYKFKEVETDDFRHALEAASGENLERFFHQWVTRPGLPRAGVWYEWSESDSALHVRVVQTQKIDADNPAYVLRIPVELRFAGSEPQTVYVNMDSRQAEASFVLAERPTDARMDPEMTCALTVTVKKKIEPPEAPAPAEGAEPSEPVESR
ncbi:MAG: M1 family metallopeptidase [Phycisphaerales bacterium]|nr:M1 family metallopeptidase [Phycisphaerales bacterium]